MKTTFTFASIGAAFVLSAVAGAQSFTPVLWQSSVAGSNATFTSSGSSYTANLNGFNLNGARQGTGEVGWIFNWDAGKGKQYSGVQLKITGQVKNGDVNIVGNETTLSRMTTPPEIIGVGSVNQTFTGDNNGWHPFTLMADFAYNKNVQFGQSQKDLLHFVTGSGALAQISSIQQNFKSQPVPEPTSMVVMAAGVASVLGLKRKKKVSA